LKCRLMARRCSITDAEKRKVKEVAREIARISKGGDQEGEAGLNPPSEPLSGGLNVLNKKNS